MTQAGQTMHVRSTADEIVVVPSPAAPPPAAPPTPARDHWRARRLPAAPPRPRGPPDAGARPLAGALARGGAPRLRRGGHPGHGGGGCRGVRRGARAAAGGIGPPRVVDAGVRRLRGRRVWRATSRAPSPA